MQLHHKTDNQIFRSHATYYAAARFFPGRIRYDVQKLYSFLQTADDYVDRVPPDVAPFKNLVGYWEQYRSKPMSQIKHDPEDSLNIRVVKNICQLIIIHQINPELVDAYLEVLRRDTDKRRHFKRFEDVHIYMKDSGEAAGKMLARILNLPPSQSEAVALHGRANQYLNFIRDIKEDTGMGRTYFSQDEIKKHGLKNLSEEVAREKPKEFKKFIRGQIERYTDWQNQADAEIIKIPRRLRAPFMTLGDINKWTARRIRRNPFIVFKKQVRPSRLRVYLTGISHLLD